MYILSIPMPIKASKSIILAIRTSQSLEASQKGEKQFILPSLLLLLPLLSLLFLPNVHLINLMPIANSKNSASNKNPWKHHKREKRKRLAFPLLLPLSIIIPSYYVRYTKCTSYQSNPCEKLQKFY